jgi:predicted LPLAT superfamily acyltransferase
MSRQWTQQRERGSPWLVRLIRWIALNIGRPPARLLLYPISFYFLFRAVPQRRASRDYLRRVLGREPHLGQILRHIHCFAATILDRVYLLGGRHGNYRIGINGLEQLLEAVDSGRGCLLLGAHIGSFDVLRALALEDRPFELKILMYPEHNELLTRLINDLNPELADAIIPLGEVDTMMRVHEALQQGAVVGLLGDRAADDDKKVVCDLLGAPANFPAGPAQLAAGMRVPVVLFLGLYHGNRHYQIHFEQLPELDLSDRSRRPELIQEWMQEYADRLGSHLQRMPYNWFNFYGFWDEA